MFRVLCFWIGLCFASSCASAQQRTLQEILEDPQTFEGKHLFCYVVSVGITKDFEAAKAFVRPLEGVTDNALQAALNYHMGWFNGYTFSLMIQFDKKEVLSLQQSLFAKTCQGLLELQLENPDLY